MDVAAPAWTAFVTAAATHHSKRWDSIFHRNCCRSDGDGGLVKHKLVTLARTGERLCWLDVTEDGALQLYCTADLGGAPRHILLFSRRYHRPASNGLPSVAQHRPATTIKLVPLCANTPRTRADGVFRVPGDPGAVAARDCTAYWICHRRSTTAQTNPIISRVGLHF